MNPKTKTILVVDDSGAFRLLAREELEAEGFAVEEARDGFEALIRLGSPPAPDLIVMDVEMPRIDGFEVCKRLSDDHYGRLFKKGRPPVVFVTGGDSMEHRGRGFELGAADFLAKPFDKGEIAKVAKEILAEKTPAGGLTALVVDDSAAARKVVSDCLEREGLKVLEAADGRAALDILTDLKDGVDLVVTDLFMPVMDGDELIRKIRGELKLEHVPVIVLTAMGDRTELLELFRAGASDYLVKPFAREELLARINVHLERTQLTRRLSAMIDELKNLNRMKDNLLAVCSHDLRSPLTGIIGFTDLLLDREYLTMEDREGLEAMKSSGATLLGFIDDILDLGRARSNHFDLKMGTVSLSDVIQRSIGALKQNAVRKNQDLDFVNRYPEALVNGNAVALNRVMNNLISNALKYTPEGGKIRVALEAAGEDRIAVEVSDNGVGVPEEKMPRLFDPFTRFHQESALGEYGVGLGMSIVKEIVDRHNAQIDVASAIGHGTRVRLVFMKAGDAPPQAPAETVRSGKRERRDGNNGSVLLAEDDALSRKLSVRLLVQAGFQTETACDGKEALEKFLSSPDKYDLVFMDCRMPVMDGFTAAARIREAGFESVPIAALTAHTVEKELEKCFRAGMNEVVLKPLTVKTVRDVFEKLVPGKAKSASGREAGGMDLEQIAGNLNFDRKQCAKYVKLYVDSAGASMRRLATALESRDSEAAADALHSIKGGAASLKLETLRALAETLEHLALDGFLDEISEKKGLLEKELNRVQIISVM